MLTHLPLNRTYAIVILLIISGGWYLYGAVHLTQADGPDERTVWPLRLLAVGGSGRYPAVGNAVGPTNDSTEQVALGDVNGDGHLDLAVGNNTAQGVIYLNNGNGTFAPTGHNVGSATDLIYSLAFGDINGDGNLDLATGKDGQNVVYLNDGNGTFAPTGNNFGTGSDETFAVSLGDVDGDGDLDLATGNDGQNRVYLNNGDGTFTGGGNNVGSALDLTTSLAFGDVNNDGHLDLAVGNDGEQNVVYLNNGNGTFAPTGNNFGTGNDNTKSIAIADLNKDGLLDLAVGNDNGQSKIHLNNGGGTFTGGGNNVGPATGRADDIALGDVNGDGGLDVVIGNNGQQNWAYLNKGDGTFTNQGNPIGSAAHPTLSMALGDIDSDGDLDVATGNAGQQNRIYLNRNAVQAVTPMPESHSTALTATLAVSISGSLNPSTITNQNIVVYGNQQGKMAGTLTSSPILITPTNSFFAGELVQTTVSHNVLDSNGGTISPFVWQFRTATQGGLALFTSNASPFGLGNDASNSVAVGDVDGDADLDIAVGNQDQNTVYLNQADGTFAMGGNNFGTGSENTLAVAFGDMDGDGDLDLVVGNDGQNAVYLNAGDGTFSPTGNTVGPATGFTTSLALADADGDGDLDIAVGSDSQNIVYLNNGDGSFPTSGNNFGTGSDQTFDVAFGDMDGDGDLDLAVGNDGQNAVYLNAGDGTFSPTGNTVGTSSQNTLSLDLGDMDGDGDLDMITGNTGQDVVYFNGGDGSFAASGNNVGAGSNGTISIDLGDIDGDSDLDVVLGHANDPDLAYLNNGDGSFAAVGRPVDSANETTTALSLADINGDGDLDVISVKLNQQNGVHFNQNQADLSLSKQVEPTTAQPGTLVTYQLVFTNTGPQLARNVTIIDQMPVTITHNSLSVTTFGPIITPTAGTPYRWQVADLAANEGGIITVTGTLSSSLPIGSFNNQAIITSTTFDPVFQNNQANVILTVVDTLSNRTPTAQAGDNRLVKTDIDIALNGNRSSDPDGDSLIYHWQQTAGVPVVLNNSRIATPVFTTPTQASDLSFTLTVTDPLGLSDSDAVIILVRDEVIELQPDAGAAFTVVDGNQTSVIGQIPSGAVTETVVLVYQVLDTTNTTPPDLQYTDFGFELTAYINQIPQSNYRFSSPISLTITYPINLATNFDETTLALYQRVAVTSSWQTIGITLTSHSQANNQLIISIIETNQFGLFGRSRNRLSLPIIMK